jgi:hypothetical protein
MVVEIIHKPASMGYDVYFYEKAIRETSRGAYVNKPIAIEDGRIIWSRVFVDEMIAFPTPSWELNEFDLKDLAEALDKLGVKTDNDSKLQGKIEAMTEHLQDLRKLLKLRY